MSPSSLPRGYFLSSGSVPHASNGRALLLVGRVGQSCSLMSSFLFGRPSSEDFASARSMSYPGLAPAQCSWYGCGRRLLPTATHHRSGQLSYPPVQGPFQPPGRHVCYYCCGIHRQRGGQYLPQALRDSLWGCPTILISDSGLQSPSKLSAAIYELMGIKKVTTSSDHSQTNGGTE